METPQNLSVEVVAAHRSAALSRVYVWVHPNPAGVSRQLMTLEEAFEFIRGWPTYGASGETIELTLAFLTDADVEALPSV